MTAGRMAAVYIGAVYALKITWDTFKGSYRDSYIHLLRSVAGLLVYQCILLVLCILYLRGKCVHAGEGAQCPAVAQKKNWRREVWRAIWWLLLFGGIAYFIVCTLTTENVEMLIIYICILMVEFTAYLGRKIDERRGKGKPEEDSQETEHNGDGKVI